MTQMAVGGHSKIPVYSDGPDTIVGGSGSDDIDGGFGGDVMSGGCGDDIYIYNTGDALAAGETITEDTEEGTDRVFVVTSTNFKGLVGGDDTF